MLSTILLWMSTAFVLCGHPVTFFPAPSNEKDLPVVQHGVLEKMTVILDEAISGDVVLQSIDPSFVYATEEHGDKFIISCTSTELNFDFVIKQIEEPGNYSRTIKVDRTDVKFQSIVLDNSIDKYPFEVHGHLDCDQIRVYTLKKDNRSYLFIESTPSSWTALMSAKFSFYQLVAINEKLGVQTIAAVH